MKDEVIIQGKKIFTGDKVYDRGAEMTFERLYRTGKRDPDKKTVRLYYSWYNEKLEKTEEGLFRDIDLTLAP
jgi:CRISPR/Cas system Type II protein with McrA/HNH and RuvC-like nuclease domain